MQQVILVLLCQLSVEPQHSNPAMFHLQQFTHSMRLTASHLCMGSLRSAVHSFGHTAHASHVCPLHKFRNYVLLQLHRCYQLLVSVPE